LHGGHRVERVGDAERVVDVGEQLAGAVEHLERLVVAAELLVAAADVDQGDPVGVRVATLLALREALLEVDERLVVAPSSYATEPRFVSVRTSPPA
jgi:hypothetical protein